MVINYALIGSNENPDYLDFWPLVSKVWRKRFNITPVLGLITGNKIEIKEDNQGIIIKIPILDGYETSYLSQIVRLYLPKFLNGNCIISDIDMIPLSKKYFLDDLKKYNEEDFIILSSHHPQTFNINQYPMCYVVGSDLIFKKIFPLEYNWLDFVKNIPNNGWYSDQIYLYEMINKAVNINFKFPERFGGFEINRIDRVNWVYSIEKLLSDDYIDCHSLRPYNSYKKYIDDLINLLC